jgi:hypothetical protein
LSVDCGDDSLLCTLENDEEGIPLHVDDVPLMSRERLP